MEGSPTSGIGGGADVIVIKCKINAMRLEHLETTPSNPQSMEKLSSMKSIPGAKKVGGLCEFLAEY